MHKAINDLTSPAIKCLGKVLAFALSLSLATISYAQTQELTVYSARSKHLIEAFFKDYEQQTGVKINYVNGQAGALRQRLLLEKENTKADVLLTVDAGNLWQAANEGLLAKTPSIILKKNVPDYLRDVDNQWFALTIRARTFVYSPELVKTSELTNYTDLARPKWKNKLCLRTSKKVYNQSLVAMLLHHYGNNITEGVVKGWVKNLAHKPYAKDSHVIQAVAKKKCAVGLVNTYYYGRKIKKDPTFSKKVKIAWASQGANDFGTHINISGAGVIKHSKNKKQALKFIEWLSSTKVQAQFASVNLEYPVNKEAQIDPIMQEWGDFREDKSPLYFAGKNQVEAVKLMDRAGYK